MQIKEMMKIYYAQGSVAIVKLNTFNIKTEI